jgi:hypothetical protein
MQGNAFYTLLPLADLDLFAFIEKFPTVDPSKSQVTGYDGNNVVMPIDDEIMRRPIQDRAFVEWFLSQLSGLAKALQLLNEILSNVDAPKPGNQDSTAFSLDINPSGILVFFDEKSRYGTLKVDEFGSASVKEDVLSANMYDRPSTLIEATEVDATRTYENLERDLTGFPSRSAEIWSLGCVFTELLTWALDPFRERREQFPSTRFLAAQASTQVATEALGCRPRTPLAPRKPS